MNKLIIEIHEANEALDVREGISKKGNPYKMITQYGFVFLNDVYPIKVKIKMEENQPFYPRGRYELILKESFSVSPHGDLEIGRKMILIPCPKQ